MRTHACALLLAACCLRAAGAQSDGGAGRTNVWRDPIRFKSKAADSCTMAVTGQGDVTRLRVACVGAQGARHYWCEYEGKPRTCRNYNLDPRHYFTQLMWGLRKLANACGGPRAVKPQMCRRAPDEAQMVFSASSSSASSSSASSSSAQPGRLAAPDADGPRRGPYGPGREPPPVREAQDATPPPPEPTTPPVQGRARALARDYCWRSFHGVCAFVIGWFPH